MIALWISAALISAAAAALIFHRAARASAPPAGANPSVAVYRRQLAEIDDLAERGLLLENERRSAHAEAARRLLAAADEAPPPAAAPSRGARLAIAITAAAAPLVAIGVYVFVGSPGVPDQPFARRLAAWRAADPGSLTPEQMAAVLQLIVRDRPKDPQALFYLSRAQLAAGDPYSAALSLENAIDLAPTRADLWTALGETEIARDDGDVSGGALKAFQRAAQLDPNAPTNRYFLARAQIASGDVDGGLAAWRALDRDMAASDPRRSALDQEIAVVSRTRALPQTQAAGGAPDQSAFIRSMVDGLAARLNAQPNDPAGWARLVRAYAVLGDHAALSGALARAHVLFKAQPDVVRAIDQAATAPQS